MGQAVLTALPPEILHLVIDVLRGIDIENLAKTLNSSITGLCLSHRKLKYRLCQRKNRKAMAELWGDVQEPFTYAPETSYDILGLEDEWGPFVDIPNRDGRMVLDYFDFDESLGWLDFRPSKNTKPDLQDELYVKVLESAADHCGITFPENFRTMLLYGMTAIAPVFGRAETGGHYVEFNGTMFVKVCWPKEDLKMHKTEETENGHQVDETAEGYLLTFVADQQGCWYFSLFLESNTHGGMSRYCVLGSESNPCEDVSADEASLDADGRLPVASFAIVKPKSCFPEISGSPLHYSGGEWSKTSESERKATFNIWPVAPYFEGNDFRPHALNFDDFVAANWLQKMEQEIEEMDFSFEEGDKNSSNDIDAHLAPYRQHLIDIYSTKGRQSGWIPRFKPSK